jgi:snoRNA binding domain, fibrillarin
MALALDEDRADILRLVQTKMGRIAPNLSAVVGTAIAAQLMGVAGGLSSLSQMPACNIQVGNVALGFGVLSGLQKSVLKQFWVAGGLSSLSQKPA